MPNTILSNPSRHSEASQPSESLKEKAATREQLLCECPNLSGHIIWINSQVELCVLIKLVPVFGEESAISAGETAPRKSKLESGAYQLPLGSAVAPEKMNWARRHHLQEQRRGKRPIYRAELGVPRSCVRCRADRTRTRDQRRPGSINTGGAFL
jgi:hypothetical protein